MKTKLFNQMNTHLTAVKQHLDQSDLFTEWQSSCHTTFPPGLLGHHITLSRSHNLSDNHEYISQPLFMLLPFTGISPMI